MRFPVLIHAENGHYAATVVGTPELRTTSETYEKALDDLKALIRERISNGTMVLLDVPDQGSVDPFGAFKDDPTLQDICDDAYRERDAERAALEKE